MKDFIEVEGLNSAVQINVNHITHFHRFDTGAKIYLVGKTDPIVVKDSYTKIKDLLSNR